MHENLSGAIKDFKYSVIKPKKFFSRVQNLKEYKNVTYSQFRSGNICFDVFEAAFLNIDNDNTISPSQLTNISKYISNNLRGNKVSEIKRAIMKIDKLNVALVARLSELDHEEDARAYKNIECIISELGRLRGIILDGSNCKSLEKEIQFEMLMDELLNTEDYDTTTLLYTLFYNLPVLGNSIGNSKKFNDRLYRCLLKTIHENDRQKKNYYVYLANLIHQANIYKLDRRVSNICGFNFYDNNTQTKLNEKISNLEYNTATGRYRLEDYIVTIDNESTSKFDDAISINKMDNGSYILGIHIADVYSLGIVPSSNESIEFKSRASLVENIDKNAISLFVEISDKGLIVDKRMLMTNITVNHNLLYDDVACIISNKNDDKLCQTVIDLIGLYNIVDNTKCPDFPGPSSMAHALVQKYMLLYGCVVSDLASKSKYPILYQIDSDKKSEVSLSEVHVYTGFDEDNNLSTYARFTSPIWDLRSFINQTSICKCVFDRIDAKERNALKLKLSNFKNKINKGNKPSGLQE